MAQQGKQFLPGVLVVPVGTSVHFPNRDSVRHHVYSFSPAKKFELKLYTGTPANPVVFERAGVVTLGCNIHDRMVGWIVVVDTPYYAQAAEGAAQVQINGVPPSACRGVSTTPPWSTPAGRTKLAGWRVRSTACAWTSAHSKGKSCGWPIGTG